jgi:hypothetical protein
VVLFALGVVGVGLAASPLGSAALQLVQGLVGIVGAVALGYFARQMAMRLPSFTLAKQSMIVMWGYLISLGVMLIGGAVMVAALVAVASSGGGPGRQAMIIGTVPICAGAVGALVFAVWALVLIILFRTALTEAATLARRTWARHAQPDRPAGFAATSIAAQYRDATDHLVD